MHKTAEFSQAILLAVTFTLAIGILYFYSWPFAFLFPLLCLHVRFHELTSMPLKDYLSLFLVIASGIGSAFLISLLYPISVLLFLLIIALAMFLNYWWDKHDPNHLYTSLRVLTLILVSSVTLASHDITSTFSLSLTVCVFIAMGLSLLVDRIYTFLFVKGSEHSTNSHQHTPSVEEAISNEWQALLIFMPAAFAFVVLDLSHYYVVLVAICVLTLSPDLSKIRGGTWQFLLANVIGGGIAILGYYGFLLASNWLGYSVTLQLMFTFGFVTILGLLIYCSRLSHIGHYMLSPFAILLVQSDRVGFSILDNFQIRITSVSIAVVYIALVVGLLSFVRTRRRAP